LIHIASGYILLWIQFSEIRKSMDSSLKQDETMKNSTYKMAFEGKHVDANFVKNLLAENDIPAFLKNDALGQLFPLFAAHGGLQPVKVYVDKENLPKAQEIIDAYFEDDSQRLDK
jgi:hypothetical protein